MSEGQLQGSRKGGELPGRGKRRVRHDRPGKKAALGRRLRRMRQRLGILRVALAHPGVPWYARALIVGLTAYALSPIDLIPDFIPVVGYLDDLVILPLGVFMAWRLLPRTIRRECVKEYLQRKNAKTNPRDSSRPPRL